MLAQPAVKTKIQFDRSNRQWLAINGTVTKCADKTEALLVALGHDRPDLAQRVKDIAQAHGNGKTLVNGLLKAASLIAKGKVFSNGEVASQSRADVYHRTRFDGMTAKYSCSCEATVYDAILGKSCAHCLAQHLAYLVGIELPSPPIPYQGEPVVIEGRPDWPGMWNGGTTPDEEIEIDF